MEPCIGNCGHGGGVKVSKLKKHEPGTFRELTRAEEIVSLLKQLRGNLNKGEPEIKLETYPDLVAKYVAFRDNVYNPKSVFHPCMANDASPSEVFGNVTYLDADARYPLLFKQKGLTALTSDIDDYKPDQEHDLVILLNPAISSARAVKYLKPGGYVLTNDYHHNATELALDKENYKLIGTVNHSTESGRAEVSRDLTGLFELPDNLEQLKAARPHYHSIATEEIGGQVDLTEEILKEVRGLSKDNFRDWSIHFTVMDFPFKKTAEFYIFQKKGEANAH